MISEIGSDGYLFINLTVFSIYSLLSHEIRRVKKKKKKGSERGMDWIGFLDQG